MNREILTVKKLYIGTYGCQMGVADSGDAAIGGGWIRADEQLRDADAIFVNTCSIRESAEIGVIQRLEYFTRSGENEKPPRYSGY